MTAGPGDQKPGAAGGRGRLRASHADREHVIDTLKAAFVQGRLTMDEFEARVGLTFASRTYAELATLTADIPAGLAVVQPPRQPARAQPRPPLSKAVVWGACAMIPPAMVVGEILTDSGIFVAFFLLATISYFMAVLIAGAEKLDSWHQKRSGGQLPPRSAQWGRGLKGEPDGGFGDDLSRCEARRDARARRVLLGRGAALTSGS